MEITEKDLEDLIFESLVNDDADILLNAGFGTQLVNQNFPNKIYWSRQVELKQYGRADIIGYTRCEGTIFVDIMELKNVPLTPKDFDQLCRYMTAVGEIISNSFRRRHYPVIRGYLIGPEIDSGHYLDNFIQSISIFTFKYGIRGFSFEYHNGGWRRASGNLKLSEVSASKTIARGVNDTQNTCVNG